MSKNLQKLFSPKSIALIGASDEPGSVGHALLRNIRDSGFTGDLFPVNPKHDSIDGLSAHDSVREIRETVDLAIIAVPEKVVEDIVGECVEKEVGACVIITAGFGETGEEGKTIEKRIAETAAKAGLPLIGPNCLGVINTDPDTPLDATFSENRPEKGSVSFISQSGAVGVYGIDYAINRQLGFDCFASLGNKIDVSENDLLQFLSGRSSTNVVIAYLEDFKDAAGLRAASEKLVRQAGKPLIVFKAGTSESGKRATASHTGALAGSSAPLDDVLRQLGILRATELQDLFNISAILSLQPHADGNRIGIITNAGGPSIIATDLAEERQLRIPRFSDRLRKALADELPAAASPANPVDLLGDADPDRFSMALEQLLDSNEVDRLLIIATNQRNTDLPAIAERIAAVLGKFPELPKPVACSLAAFGEDEKRICESLERVRVPNHHFVIDAVKCLAAGQAFSELRQPREEPEILESDKKAAAQVIDSAVRQERTHIPAPESYAIFKAYGMRIVPNALATSREEAVAKAKTFSGEMALSVVSDDILHKTGTGGVVLGVGSADEAGKAWNRIMERVTENEPEADIRGVQIQEMVSGGPKMILGMQEDPTFGRLLMFGLGGSMVEALEDVSFAMAPVNRVEARRMIDGIRSRTILDGKRGNPPSDIHALEDALLGLSQLTMDFPQIREIDLNPVYALSDKALLTDARVLLHSK